ncbi:MAG: 30S ribosomal protein S12 methylthiotransferase RimO [bacterium]
MVVRVGMISLGCSKNLVDSEVMLGLLAENGFEITPEEKEADILIINTCAFIESAKQESMEAIIQATKDKRKKKIIVAGCLAQRYADMIKLKMNGKIHAIVGTGDFQDIVEICKFILNDKEPLICVTKKPKYLYDYFTPRLLTTPKHYAYLKIAEGCDNCCSYCVIPQIRGNYRSRTPESIINEAKALSKSGVKELILIAQDTTYYGNDIDEDIVGLLKNLVKLPDVRWIRVLYTHPDHITEDFIKLIADEEKICSYIDIPFQHINDNILKSMGRETTKEKIYRLIEKIKNTIPNVTIRTSLMVGFPGETEEQFEELVQFIKDVQFDHLGVFEYSAEEGTYAYSIENQVPEVVKNERLDIIAELHESIAEKKRKDMIGKNRTVLIDYVDTETDSAIGRTEGQSPEIDDIIYVIDSSVSSGEFVDVEILGTYEIYDLIGKVVQ